MWLGRRAAWRWWKGEKEEGLTMATAAAAALEAGPVCVCMRGGGG